MTIVRKMVQMMTIKRKNTMKREKGLLKITWIARVGKNFLKNRKLNSNRKC
jgi:hypothetical protein